ncbi:MAG: Rid family hydrolase [Bacteroidales bacterium]|jgi:enamine deaminase RidA (YjgF/YER057c/UK114 family)
MDYLQHTFEKYPFCSLQAATFHPDGTSSGKAEHHLIFRLKEQPPNCLTALRACIQDGLAQEPYKKAACVFARYFLQNAVEQRPQIHATRLFPGPCVLSFIEQPPANGTPLAVWLYLQEPGIFDQPVKMLRTTEKFHLGGNAAQQTKQLLTDYGQWLQAKGLSVKDNMVSTCFYLNDIDEQYAVFAKTYADYLQANGIEPPHYYMTGNATEGSNGAPGSCVTLDACAVAGLEASRIQRLDHGRGVSLSLKDRKHVYVHGVAGVDEKGLLEEPHNLRAQTFRMWGNAEAALGQAKATWQDVISIIVYVRNKEDYSLVKGFFLSRFPNIPCIILAGKPCHPTWLIAMECMAICRI